MSAIRTNPNILPDLISALSQLQQQQSTSTLELATGSRINKPSDDPASAALLTQIDNLSSQVDSFQRSVSSIAGELQTADSTMNSVVEALQRAISLGVEGANGTLSDSDRADVSAELQGIQSQLLSLANTTYQGQFIFAGTSGTQPYVADPASPSGITYQGNNDVNFVTIGNSYQLQVNLPGSKIFNGAGADVFQSMQNLITALNTNTGVDTAVTQLRAAYDNVNDQRVFYGNAINQTTAQQTVLSTENLDLSQQQNTVGAADLASVSSQIVNDNIAQQATLEAIGRTPQTSLFDYLRG